MGQVNLPVLNKTGTSVYWGSSWSFRDDYKISFKEDFLIKGFIPLLIFSKSGSSRYFLRKTIKGGRFAQGCIKYNLYFRYGSTVNLISRILRRRNKIPYYPTKLNIVRYGKWVIVFFKVFLPRISAKKLSSSMFFFKNLLQKYHLSALKLQTIRLKKKATLFDRDVF